MYVSTNFDFRTASTFHFFTYAFMTNRCIKNLKMYSVYKWINASFLKWMKGYKNIINTEKLLLKNLFFYWFNILWIFIINSSLNPHINISSYIGKKSFLLQIAYAELGEHHETTQLVGWCINYQTVNASLLKEIQRETENRKWWKELFIKSITLVLIK